WVSTATSGDLGGGWFVASRFGARRQQGRQVMGERWRAVVVWQTGGGRRRVGDVRKGAGGGPVVVLFLAWWWSSDVVGRVLGLGKSQREDGLKMNDDDG
ncbi:hypothetical protein Dimus_034621, partial [Dionaea muscipula]